MQVAHGNGGHLQGGEGSHVADREGQLQSSSSSDSALVSSPRSAQCFLELRQRACYPIVGHELFLGGLCGAAGSSEHEACGLAVCDSQCSGQRSHQLGVRGPEAGP